MSTMQIERPKIKSVKKETTKNTAVPKKMSVSDEKFLSALEKVNRQYGSVLQNLAK